MTKTCINCENFSKVNGEFHKGVCDAWTDEMRMNRNLPMLPIYVEKDGDASECEFFDAIDEDDSYQLDNSDYAYESAREGY